MSIIIAAGLLLGAPALESHQVVLDHQGQRVDVTYRSDLAIKERQVGTASGPGRQSTLRCAWSAQVSVQREARSAAGHVLSRTISSDSPITGSRSGWCAGQREAIASEVAARGQQVREHLLAVAERDDATLRAELDATHATVRS